MSAATQSINTPQRSSDEYRFDVAASTVIYAGTLVMSDDAKTAEPAAPFTTGGANKIVGVAMATVDNSTGAKGDQHVIVKRSGAFHFTVADWTNYAGALYAIDDQTLTTAADDGEGNSYAAIGTVCQRDANGAWVTI